MAERFVILPPLPALCRRARQIRMAATMFDLSRHYHWCRRRERANTPRRWRSVEHYTLRQQDSYREFIYIVYRRRIFTPTLHWLVRLWASTPSADVMSAT
jgi:hypothetical protein